MRFNSKCQLLVLAGLLLIAIGPSLQTRLRNENNVKTATFLSPNFVLEPGSVINKFYYNIDFPKGHIAIKSFDAEVVDESRNPVPLHAIYLHHWLVARYYQRKVFGVSKYNGHLGFNQSDFIMVRNSGICEMDLPQYFGLGSETRKTVTYVPDPYGIEVGNPVEVPPGYDERWFLNVHAIDTRGSKDMLGCTECRCDLYNVTKDEYNRDIEPNYIGGLRCCYDETRCRTREGFQGPKRSLYLKYTVKYVNWHAFIVPVKIYMLDVTDTWKKQESTGLVSRHHCQIEYEVESCSAAVANNGCIHTKKTSVTFPNGGDVIYAVAHQHPGGVGSTLLGEDGRVICSSHPIYGEGKQPGNEAGFIVGMSTCYPRPGSVKISEGETLTLLSNYSSDQRHTGVMGLFYILLAESSRKSSSILHSGDDMGDIVILHNAVWAIAGFGIAALVAATITYQRQREREEVCEWLLL
ncbi:hypothetical protein T459_33176 [Capsicum annuum]|uniref:Stress up-regulated Nod 19 protein n=1 Tax=Capsicum annuum TaxID=4072 RepID=A0A1U8H4J9_CAPAN|nr:uncharacterized protein LOC107857063 [Capsicum annuum]XP_047259966.1 uncharacterized protein LOC107857073 isoform X1 [Capsicum annuum]PHT62972.1 hypothetical protein T459_33176 [Capsicum annuum]